MRKALIVAQREFLTNVRRPGFLFASFGIPALIVGLLVLIFAIAIQSEEDKGRVGTVGYVDHANVLTEAREKPDNFIAYDTEGEARASLNARELGAYFVLPDDYLDTGAVRIYSVIAVPDATKDEIDTYLVTNLGASLNNDPLLMRLQQPDNLTVHTLGNDRSLRESALVGLFILPMLFVFVVILSSQMTSGYLMYGVIEEKTNRLMEVLTTSLTPFQLLVGKLIGLGAMGLLQVIIWLVMGSLALRLAQSSEALAGIEVPSDLVIVAIIFFLLSYVMVASFSAGVGAVIGSEQESRQFAGLFTFVMMIPFFFIVNFITDGNGPLPTFLTLFPLTAPVAIIMRVGFSAVPTWQLIVSILLMLAMTIVVVWASARVFRWALLMYGKRPGLRDVLRAIRRAPRVGITQE